MLNELKDKVAIITGAASGIGRAAVEVFAREGATLVLADINEPGGVAAAKAVVDAGGNAAFTRCDVTKEAEVGALTKFALDKFGAIHCAFNNAGAGGPSKAVTALTEADWLARVQLNLMSVGYCMKHQIPVMKRQGGGAIVNTASVCGVIGIAGLGPYSAAKAGIMALSRVAAAESSKDGVRINVIAPGITGQKPERKELHGAVDWVSQLRIPRGRIGEFSEIAEIAAFLCSSRSSVMTGAVVFGDSGLAAI
jgi:NAD(P)-dependent dehydrogenase (short-subunit alcohol dehydrogenase family)